jgi:hypothetical protein
MSGCYVRKRGPLGLGALRGMTMILAVRGLWSLRQARAGSPGTPDDQITLVHYVHG